MTDEHKTGIVAIIVAGITVLTVSSCYIKSQSIKLESCKVIMNGNDSQAKLLAVAPQGTCWGF